MSTPAPRGDAAVVELRAASVGYEGRPALRWVDFRLRPGEAVAILGPNGAGKSTLVRALVGLADVLDGTVELFGVDVRRRPPRERVGYVPQRLSHSGGVPVTVTEVVTSGRLARHAPWGRLRATDRDEVRKAIDAVGLTDHASAPVATLSGGQQRRVRIARALCGRPDLLLMDEPTAGVDWESQELLAETLRPQLDAGVALLLVAHELGPVAPLVERVVVLRDGVLAYDGPPLTGHLHDDSDWHHPHGEPPTRPGVLGLEG